MALAGIRHSRSSRYRDQDAGLRPHASRLDALRLATEHPLLACRVAQQGPARGPADADVVGSLLQALSGGQDTQALAESGLRLCRHDRFTGAVMAGEGYQTVDAAQFGLLAREHPAVMLPPGTGSLLVAVTLWAAAVERALRRRRRLFQPAPPADADHAGPLLTAYLREKDCALQHLARVALPDTVRSRVLDAVGPSGILAYVGDPQPGHLGGVEVPIRYRRSDEVVVTREQVPADTSLLGLDTLAGMMRLHPALQAAHEIRQALSVLTDYSWPVP